MNRLIQSTSTYLLEHAQQAVDWWPYGAEAFESAAQRDVPVLISIGYSACHWCGVMSEESFDNPDTASYLNQHFVCIKVDRLEHPHVDAAYIAVVQAMTGRAGWPLTAFTNADGLAFYAGMYYPSEPRNGQPSLRQICEAVLDAWNNRRGQAITSGRMVIDMLSQEFENPDARSVAENPKVEEVAFQLVRDHDREFGGSGNGSKFPELCLLQAQIEAWRAADRSELAEAKELRVSLLRTASSIASSALTDQVNGGIFRYTVDRAWTTPHFEKMLIDNALWLETLALLHRTGFAETRVVHTIMRRTIAGIDFSLRDSEPGAAAIFASSSSADSDIAADLAAQGVDEREGAFYQWNLALLEEVVAGNAVDSSPHQIPAQGTAAEAAHRDAQMAALRDRFVVAQTPAALRLNAGVDWSPTETDTATATAQEMAPQALPEAMEALRAAQTRRRVPQRDELITLEAQAAYWAALADAAAQGVTFGLPQGLDTGAAAGTGVGIAAAPDTASEGPFLADMFLRGIRLFRAGGTYSHGVFRTQRSQVRANLADLGAAAWAAFRVSQVTGSEPAESEFLQLIPQIVATAEGKGFLAEVKWDPTHGPLPAASPARTVITENAGPSGVAWAMRALRAHVLWSHGAGQVAASASQTIIDATFAKHTAILQHALDAAPGLGVEWLREAERRKVGVRIVHITPGRGEMEAAQGARAAVLQRRALVNAALAADRGNLLVVRNSAKFPVGDQPLAYVCHDVGGSGWCDVPTSDPSTLTEMLATGR